MKVMSQYILFAVCLTTFSIGNAKKHRELGDVNWLRNYDHAVAEAKSNGKPILILFQEIPGCSGCVEFGQDTLRHPVIVEAIENNFVPLAIRNNSRSGHDHEILKRFNEPSWNFQVVRFVDTNGKDIIPRKDRIWTPSATARRIVAALQAADRPVPDKLFTHDW